MKVSCLATMPIERKYALPFALSDSLKGRINRKGRSAAGQADKPKHTLGLFARPSRSLEANMRQMTHAVDDQRKCSVRIPLASEYVTDIE